MPAPLLEWSALRMLNQYRLFVLMALAAVFYIGGSQTVGQRDPAMFQFVHLGYLTTTLAFVYLTILRQPSEQTQFYLQHYIDLLFLGLVMFASGGVQSGIGALLVVTIALLSSLSATRYAFLFAAMATLLVLAEELASQILYGSWASNFELTALLGSILFLVAWAMTGPIRQLLSNAIPAAKNQLANLDVEQIAILNEEIIREIDTGVLVIDVNNHVQLLNDSAHLLLGSEQTALPIHVKNLCPQLFTSLQDARRSPVLATQSFVAPATGQSVLPQYIPLSSGGVLIKLDDHGHMRQQFQQLKLASLGRLSASIAHEIRNPLGAISHAVQLLQESPTMSHSDSDLLHIARRHTSRINRIVDDVLQLSNRQQVRTDPIDLTHALYEFKTRFAEENGLPDETILCSSELELYAHFDPEHLDQVLWNLCTNALLHNDDRIVTITMSCWQSQRGEAIIDIVDNGKGVDLENRDRLFEPFFSTHHSGSGLGLYIIRELCELNRANLDCIDNKDGAHFRMTMTTSQELAA